MPATLEFSGFVGKGGDAAVAGKFPRILVEPPEIMGQGDDVSGYDGADSFHWNVYLR